jgi:hypothetical protein
MDISLNTIRYLMNPAHLGILNKTDDERVNLLQKDIKFYKKRIQQATRDMIKGTYVSRDLNNSFMAYAQMLVSHFKMTDERDILQEAYSGMPPKKEVIFDKTFDCKKANSLIMRGQKKGRIEEYIEIKRKGILSQPIMPSKRIVDLRAPELRTKGVRPKKNVASTYDKDT